MELDVCVATKIDHIQAGDEVPGRWERARTRPPRCTSACPPCEGHVEAVEWRHASGALSIGTLRPRRRPDTYRREMASMSKLAQAVDDAFANTSRGLSHWPDPHPDRMPLDDEYSRVLDPAKWRIVPARADAWCEAAVEVGIARLERDTTVRWAEDSGAHYLRVNRLVPVVSDGLPLALAYAGDDPEVPTAVTIAIGDPAVVVGLSPDCGGPCDACDSGSEKELDHFDEQMRMVVSGQVRHLTAGDRRIVAFANSWSATGSFGRQEVEELLTDPEGWDEVSGSNWIEPQRRRALRRAAPTGLDL